MSTVVVAGGAGFIGSHTCEALVARGDRVIAVDNLVTGTSENVTPLLASSAFRLVEHDVCIPFSVEEPVDAVLNLASPASPLSFQSLAIEILAVGSTGTRNLLDIAKSHGAKFLMASTSEVYGEPTVHPQPESYWGNVSPVGPRSCYDEAKRFSEALTMAYHRTFGTDVRIARIFNTYGPRMRPTDGRVIPNLLTQALSGQPLTVYGDGTQTRSFCYVDDQVAGQLALLDSSATEPVNIGSSAEVTMLELAELVLDVTDSRSPIEFHALPDHDPTKRRPDLAVASSVLGWQPTTGLREGLQLTADWMLRAGVLGAGPVRWRSDRVN